MGDIKHIEQRINLLEQQLDIINLYNDSFIERLGKEGIIEYVDAILDELSMLLKMRKEYYEEQS